MEGADGNEMLPICSLRPGRNQSSNPREQEGTPKCPTVINCGQSAPRTLQVPCRERDAGKQPTGESRQAREKGEGIKPRVKD
jgi:hypothetical protein